MNSYIKNVNYGHYDYDYAFVVYGNLEVFE